MNERTDGVSSIHSWENAYYKINVLSSIFNVAARGGMTNAFELRFAIFVKLLIGIFLFFSCCC